MKCDVKTATNRELDYAYRWGDKKIKFEALAEMAKRIGRKMMTDDVIPIFRQYKLNGAGDQRY